MGEKYREMEFRKPVRSSDIPKTPVVSNYFKTVVPSRQETERVKMEEKVKMEKKDLERDEMDDALDSILSELENPDTV